jgi:hypothetical protein
MTVAGGDTKIAMNYTTKGAGDYNFSSGLGHLAGAFLGAAPTSGQTGLLVGYHNGTAVTAQQVTVGAADSGGAGFKLLRVPN